MIKDFLNPFYLISLQVIFYIGAVLNYDYVQNYRRTILIALTSYLLFIVLSFIIKIMYSNKKQSEKNIIINKETYFLLNIVNILTIIILLVTILKIMVGYGGIQAFISNYNFTVIRDIQSSLGNLGSYALILSYINPLVITIVLDKVYTLKSKRLQKLIKFLVYINLIVVFLFSMAIGARITFIYSMMTILIVKMKDMKINFKNINHLIIGIVVIMIFTLFSQGIRNRNMEESQLADISPVQILSNYYDKSIENSVYVITSDNNEAKTKGYWTFKTLFTVPKVGPMFSDIYKNYIADTIINSRDDEFSYIYSLGLNQVYNTMGIFGYQYLDWGLWSILTIAIQYLIAYLIFLKFKINRSGSKILYPIIFISFIDLLRTNALSSSFIIYYVFFYMILKIFDCFVTNYKYRHGIIKKGVDE